MTKKEWKRRLKRGFTMLELLGILAIGVILVGIAFLIFTTIRGQTEARAEADKVRSFILSLENYVQDQGYYPAVTCDATTWNTDTTCQEISAYLGDLANQGITYTCTAGSNPQITTPAYNTDIALQVKKKIEKLQGWTCTINTDNSVTCTNTLRTCTTVSSSDIPALPT